MPRSARNYSGDLHGHGRLATGARRVSASCLVAAAAVVGCRLPTSLAGSGRGPFRDQPTWRADASTEIFRIHSQPTSHRPATHLHRPSVDCAAMASLFVASTRTSSPPWPLAATAMLPPMVKPDPRTSSARSEQGRRQPAPAPDRRGLRRRPRTHRKREACSAEIVALARSSGLGDLLSGGVGTPRRPGPPEPRAQRRAQPI